MCWKTATVKQGFANLPRKKVSLTLELRGRWKTKGCPRYICFLTCVFQLRSSSSNPIYHVASRYPRCLVFSMSTPTKGWMRMWWSWLVKICCYHSFVLLSRVSTLARCKKKWTRILRWCGYQALQWTLPLAWRRRPALVRHVVIQGHLTNLRTIPHVFRKLWWMLPSSTV